MDRIATYWENDRARIICVLSISFIILATAYVCLSKDHYGIIIVSIILSIYFVMHVIFSAFLKGRMFHKDTQNYILVNMWRKNLSGNNSVLCATFLLLLMQFQIFYVCSLILLWFSCLFYGFESPDNTKVVSFFDALYVILISATTIGFGDIPPITVGGKILSILSSIVGVIIFGIVSASSWHAIQSTFVVFRNNTTGIEINPNKSQERTE